MGQQRRSFTPEFKQEAMDLCRRSGKSECQVAMPLILLKAHRGEAGIYETMDSADALSKTIWRKC